MGNLIQNLLKIPQIHIPRWNFSTNHAELFELFFVDASEEDAVAYVAHDADMKTALICSKTKVGPNKSTAIPRMELEGAVIGIRLAAMIEEQHRFSFSLYRH